MASQINSPAIVYSTVYSGTGERKHRSSASLAFVRGIHRWPVNSPHKGPVTRKKFRFDDAIITIRNLCTILGMCCFSWEIPHTAHIRRWVNLVPGRINNCRMEEILLWRTVRATCAVYILYYTMIPEYFQIKFSVRLKTIFWITECVIILLNSVTISCTAIRNG